MKKVFFSHSNTDSNLYYLLTEVLEQEGLSIFRPDRLYSGGDWQSEILAAIRKSDVFIAAMDDLNPNVLFELGYALGAGKNVLLLRSEGTKVPFDVAALPMKTIDRFDVTTAGEIAEWIRGVNVRQVPAADYATPHELFDAILRNPELLDSVAPSEFKDSAADYFADLGFNVQRVTGPNAFGYDFSFSYHDSDKRIIVEVKKHNWNSRVSVSEVQRLVGAAVVAGAQAAIIVTSGEFTSSAQHLSETSPVPVLLLNLQSLLTTSPRKIEDSLFHRRTFFNWMPK
jgi:hypothetical protein